MKTKYSNRANVLSWTMAVVGLILVLGSPAHGQRSRRGTMQTTTPVDPNVAAPSNAWASFDIILKRNIFSRQRTAPRPVVERKEQPPRVMPNPESYYLLKGVVQENDDFIAFIEDTQSGTVLRLRRGDPVARGAIKTLTLDGLEYVMEDKPTGVPLGRDLEGGHGNLSTRQMLDLAATMPTTSLSPTQTTPTAPSDAESDVIRRLMERRKQQLGQ